MTGVLFVDKHQQRVIALPEGASSKPLAQVTANCLELVTLLWLNRAPLVLGSLRSSSHHLIFSQFLLKERLIPYADRIMNSCVKSWHLNKSTVLRTELEL